MASVTYDHVFKRFGDVVAVNDLSIKVEDKEGNMIEVSEEGEVPNLLFENLGSRKVLLVDGDELVGAKQNRIVNVTIWLTPKQKTHIPVTCLEAGRWDPGQPHRRRADALRSVRRRVVTDRADRRCDRGEPRLHRRHRHAGPERHLG